MRQCYIVAAAVWCIASFAAASDSPAPASTPPDNPAPQAQTAKPVSVRTKTADDEHCRLATRDSAGAASCISSLDSDHDGVADSQDQCPDTTPGVAVDATGCALNSDTRQ
jgi:hypothetical protein